MPMLSELLPVKWTGPDQLVAAFVQVAVAVAAVVVVVGEVAVVPLLCLLLTRLDVARIGQLRPSWLLLLLLLSWPIRARLCRCSMTRDRTCS